MAEYIEGRNAVMEAFRSGMPLVRVRIARGIKETDAVREIERRARAQHVPVERVAREQLDHDSEHGAHQGVVAEAKPFAYAGLEEVISAAAAAPRSIIIALDHITDPGNLGAVARSAEVVGASAVILPNRRAAAVNATAFKASAGALAHIPLIRVTNLVRSLERFKEAGYWVAGADGSADLIAWDVDLADRLVLVLGAEGSGLSRLVRETCDLLVRLPVAGHVDSLNVAQAATTLAFEWVRQGAS